MAWVTDIVKCYSYYACEQINNSKPAVLKVAAIYEPPFINQ